MNTNLLRRLLALASIALLVTGVAACDDDADDEEAAEEQQEEEEETEEEADEEEGATLPEETEVIALDEGESEIPATIEVPVGVVTFNDDPTRIRLDYEDENTGRWGPGELFGIRVQEGNEFNTDLDDLVDGMGENEFGVTTELIEHTDDLVKYTSSHEDSDTVNHRFRMLVDLDGDTWVCQDGNYGGYSEEQMERHVEACRTLAAK